MRQHYPVATMLAIVIAYAICFTAIKVGLIYAPPFLFAALRALIGGVVVLLTLWYLGFPIWPKRKLWPWILAVAVSATTINYAVMFLSPSRTGAGIASVLGNMQPLFTITLAAIFLGERLSRINLLSLMLSLIGIIFISSPTFFGSSANSLSGPILAIAASVSAASGSILMKHLRELSVVLLVTAWQFIIGSAPLFIFSKIIETPNYDLMVNPEFIIVLLLLALFGTAFGSVAWYSLIQQYEVGQLSLGLFLVPVFGLGIALMFGEKLKEIELRGAIVILGAIILSLLSSANKKLEIIAV